MTGSRLSRAAALAVGLALAGCHGAGGRAGGPEPAGHEGHGRAEGHEGHGHGAGALEGDLAFDRGLVERLGDRRCEHEVPILECDECRYEVGAVEVAPALLSASGDDLVRVDRARAGALRGRLVLNGEVAFDDERVAHVSPRLEGFVGEVFARLGQKVSRGDKLLAMDSVELGRLRSDYLGAAARLELARANHERQSRLHDKRIASGGERQRAEAERRGAEIELAAAEEQLRLLGLPRGGGGRSSGQVVVRAPVDGTVVMLHAVRGERLSPESELATVADLRRVWVWADAYDRDLGPLLAAPREPALEAEIAAEAFPGRAFSGTVDLVGSTVAAATRTVKVRVSVDNAEELLRPGMFVEVAVSLGPGRPAVLVPAEAVVSHEGRSFVFVKIGPRRFLRRDVEAVPAHDGQVALTSGLEPGEELVVRGAFLLKSDVLRERMGAGCAD